MTHFHTLPSAMQRKPADKAGAIGSGSTGLLRLSYLPVNVEPAAVKGVRLISGHAPESIPRQGVTMKQIEMLFRRQGGRCFYCDRPMRRVKTPNGSVIDALLCTRDHVARDINPKICVAACFQCNVERGNLPAHEYIMVHYLRIEGCATP